MTSPSDTPRQATTVRLPDDLLAALDKRARDDDQSRNETITAACRAYTNDGDD